MKPEDRKDTINERVEQAITKLRKIRRRALAGDQVQDYDFVELREIVSSLHHNTTQLNNGK